MLKKKREEGGVWFLIDLREAIYELKMFGSKESHIFSSFHSQPSTSIAALSDAEASQIHRNHRHLLSGTYTTSGVEVPEQEPPNTNDGKPGAKKDRHSKIYTSQGPRDRRVRLSIGIARKFFDLQELLGFDKPSKTLDWLLTKSKNAINDLVQKRQNADTSDKGKSPEGSRKRHGRAAKDSQAVDLVKESRVKARARARERTREKMQMRSSRDFSTLSSSIPMQYMNHPNGFNDYQQLNQDMIQESVVIKMKAKPHPSIFGFHQNLIISRDFTSNCAIPAPYTSTENWDISNPQSNAYSALDQYKFNDS